MSHQMIEQLIGAHLCSYIIRKAEYYSMLTDQTLTLLPLSMCYHIILTILNGVKCPITPGLCQEALCEYVCTS